MADVDIRQSNNPGTLYVVATPIGNLEDISRRAVNVLAGVATIAAEDTRRTRSLLSALDIAPPRVIALHDHNEAELTGRLLRELVAGADVALVSDAGTPLLSDPGFHLVRECHRQDLPVRPVPGASALACALSVCPLPTADFRFLGFLPAKSAARRGRLEALAATGPLVFFEAPHRMAACLDDIAAVLPQRRLFIGREMTKRFESYLCDFARPLKAWLQDNDQLRGEFVCILEGPPADVPASTLSAERVMDVLAKSLSPTQAARIGAELLGLKRRDLYRQLQQRADD